MLVALAAGLEAALSGKEPRPLPFIALAAAGFVIGVAGHLIQSKTVVVTGILLVMCATFILPFALFISGR